MSGVAVDGGGAPGDDVELALGVGWGSSAVSE